MSLGLPQSAYRPLLLQFKDCSVLQIPPSSENSREGLRFPGVSQSIEKKMENRYGCYYQGSALWRSLRDGDFEEADVWEVLNGKQDSNNSHLWASGERPRSSSSRKHPPSAPKTISRSGSGGGGGGSSSSSTPEPAARVVQQSAPVNIPYWSNLQRQKSKKASSNSKSARDWDEEDGVDSSDGGAAEGERGESDEEEEADSKVPPHELIAMRLARSHISSFSVMEGEGRTLKGRDLSKVRNAVLTRTGFLESP